MATEADIQEPISIMKSEGESVYPIRRHIDKTDYVGGLDQLPETAENLVKLENMQVAADDGVETLNSVIRSNAVTYEGESFLESPDAANVASEETCIISEHCQAEEAPSQKIKKMSEDKEQIQNKEAFQHTKETGNKENKVMERAKEEPEKSNPDHQIVNLTRTSLQMEKIENQNLNTGRKESLDTEKIPDQHVLVNAYQHASVEDYQKVIEKEASDSQENEKEEKMFDESTDIASNKQVLNMVEATSGQNKEFLIHTPDLTVNSLNKDDETVKEACNENKNITNVKLIGDKVGEMSLEEAEDEESNQSSDSAGKETGPKAIKPSGTVGNEKDEKERILHDGTGDGLTSTLAEIPDTQNDEEASLEIRESEKVELYKPSFTLAADVSSTHESGLEEGERLKEVSSTASDDRGQDKFESSVTMRSMAPVEDEMQDKNNLDTSHAALAEEICLQGAKNPETLIVPEILSNDLVNKSVKEAKDRSEVLTEAEQVDSTANEKDKDNENHEEKIEDSFKEHDSLQSIDEKLATTEASDKENRDDGESTSVMAEDNINSAEIIDAVEHRQAETIKHNKISEMEKLERSFNVISEDINAAASSEYAETVTCIIDQIPTKSHEENLEGKGKEDKPTFTGAFSENRIPEEKNFPLIEGNKKTKSAEDDENKEEESKGKDNTEWTTRGSNIKELLPESSEEGPVKKIQDDEKQTEKPKVETETTKASETFPLEINQTVDSPKEVLDTSIVKEGESLQSESKNLIPTEERIEERSSVILAEENSFTTELVEAKGKNGVKTSKGEEDSNEILLENEQGEQSLYVMPGDTKENTTTLEKVPRLSVVGTEDDIRKEETEEVHEGSMITGKDEDTEKQLTKEEDGSIDSSQESIEEERVKSFEDDKKEEEMSKLEACGELETSSTYKNIEEKISEEDTTKDQAIMLNRVEKIDKSSKEENTVTMLPKEEKIDEFSMTKDNFEVSVSVVDEEDLLKKETEEIASKKQVNGLNLELLEKTETTEIAETLKDREEPKDDPRPLYIINDASEEETQPKEINRDNVENYSLVSEEKELKDAETEYKSQVESSGLALDEKGQETINIKGTIVENVESNLKPEDTSNLSENWKEEISEVVDYAGEKVGREVQDEVPNARGEDQKEMTTSENPFKEYSSMQSEQQAFPSTEASEKTDETPEKGEAPPENTETPFTIEAVDGPDEKLKYASESMADTETHIEQITENSNRIQDKEGEKETKEEVESKLEVEEQMNEEQNDNETIKAVILSEEVNEGVDKADDNENTKEQVIEKQLNKAPTGEKTNNEVKESSTVSTIQAPESNEYKETKNSEVEEDPNVEKEAFVTKESSVQDGGREKPGSVFISLAEQSEEKIKEEIIQETQDCYNKSDIATFAAARAERGSGEARQDVKTLPAEKQLQTPSSAVPSEEQEQITAITVENTEKEKKEEANVQENESQEDSFTAKETEETCLQKEEPKDLHSVKEDQDICMQEEEHKDLELSMKDDEIRADQTVPAEKPEEQLQTPTSAFPSEDQELRTETIVENTEKEKTEEVNMPENGSLEDSFAAKETEEISLQKEEPEDLEAVKDDEDKYLQEEEPRDLEVPKKEENTADQTLPAEKSEEQLQTPSSALSSEEQEQRTETVMEKIEKEKTGEARVPENDSQEDSVAAKETEEIWLQKKELNDLEAVKEDEDICLQEEDARELEVSEKDENSTDQTLPAEKQLRTPSSAVPPEEQEQITVPIVRKTEKEKKEEANVQENESQEDSFAAKETEEICLQKKEPQDLQSVQEDKDICSQEEEQRKLKVPKKDDEITADQTVPAEKPEEQLQTPSSVFPTEDQELRTETVVENTEKEKTEEANRPENESQEDSFAATETEDISLQKEEREDLEAVEGDEDICLKEEEPTDLEVLKKDENNADQTLPAEKSMEQLQTPSSTLPFEEQEQRTVAVVEKIEEKTGEASMPENESQEDSFAVKATENICLQKEELKDLEAVKEDEDTCMQEKPEEQLHTPSSAVPSEEQEQIIAVIGEKTEKEKKEEANVQENESQEDSFAAKETEEISLQKEEPQDLQSVKEDEDICLQKEEPRDLELPKKDDEITADQTVPGEKPEEQLQTPSSAYPTEDQELRTETTVENTDKEKTEEVNMPENETQEDSIAAKETEEISLQKEEPQDLEAVKGDQDISLQEEEPTDLEVLKKDENNADQTLPAEKSVEQLQTPSSTLPFEEQEQRTVAVVEKIEEKTGEASMPENESQEDSFAVKATEKICLQKEELKDLEAVKEDEDTCLQEKPEEQLQTPSSAVPSEEQEQIIAAIVEKTEKEKTEEANVQENESQEDSFAAKEAEEISLQKEEPQDLQSAKEDEDICLQKEEPRDLELPKKDDEITADQTVPEEKPEEQLQTPPSAYPTEDQELRTETTVENTNKEKTEEVNMPENETQEDSFAAKETEEISLQKEEPEDLEAVKGDQDKCLQEEEPRDLEVLKKDENNADQTLPAEKSVEQLKTPSSTLPFEEQEQRTVAVVEKIEKVKTREASMPESESQEDSFAAKATEEICLQKEEFKDLEAVKEDEDTCLQEKPEEQLQTPSSAVPSEEQKQIIAAIVDKTEKEKTEEANVQEDSFAAKETEDISLQREEPQDLQSVKEDEDICVQKEEPRDLELPKKDDEITIDQTVPEEKPEEQLQTSSSAYPTEDQELRTETTVENTEKKKTEEVNMPENGSQEDSFAAKETEEISLQKEEPEDLEAVKEDEDICLQEEQPRDLELPKKDDEITADQTVPAEKPEEQLQTPSSAYPTADQELKTETTVENTDKEKTEEVNMPENENQEDSFAAKETEEISLQKEEPEDLEAVKGDQDICLQEEEPRDLEVLKKDENNADQTLPAEKSVEQLKTPSFTLPFEEQEQRTVAVVEKIEKEKTGEASMLESESQEDSFAAKGTDKICLQKEELKDLEAVKEDEDIYLQEKPEEQLQSPSSAVPSEEQEQIIAAIVDKTEKEKTEEANVQENESQEDSFDAKETEDISLQKEEPQDLQSVKEDEDICLQEEEPRDLDLPKKDDEITADQTVPAEKPEEQLQTPSSAFPTEDQELRTETTVENTEKEKTEDVNMPENETREDSFAAKETEEISLQKKEPEDLEAVKDDEDKCLQEEEPRDLEVLKKDENNADQTLPAEKSVEQLQTPSSTLPFEEQEQRTVAVVEKIEKEKSGEASMPENENQEDSFAAKATEKICLQKDELKDLEAVKEDEDTCLQEKPEEQLQTPSSAVPSEEQEQIIAAIVGKTEKEKTKEANVQEDSFAAKETEDISLQKEEPQDLQSVKEGEDICLQEEKPRNLEVPKKDDEITADQTVPTEKPEEQLQTPSSALPSEDQELRTETIVENTEKKKTEEVNMPENESQEDSFAAKETEEISLQKEEPEDLEAVKEDEDISLQEEQPRDLEVPKKHKNTADQTLPVEESEEKLQTPSSALPSEELGLRTEITVERIEKEKTEDETMPENENQEDSFAAKKTEEICLQKEEPQDHEAVKEDEDTCLQEEEPRDLEVPKKDDEITADQTVPAEKPEEQLQTPSSALLSENQELRTETIVENTEKEKTQEASVQEDSFAAKETEEICFQKEEPQDLQSVKEDEDICLQEEEPRDLEVPKKDDATTTDQTVPAEKPEEQLWTPSSVLPSEDHELRTEAIVENIEKEKTKEVNMPENESHENSFAAKETEEISLQKEEPEDTEAVNEDEDIYLQEEKSRDLEDSKKDENTADQPLSAEKPEEKLQTPSSALPSEEQELRTAITVEKIEKEKIEDTTMPKNESQEDSFAAKKTEEIYLQKEEPQDLEAVKEDESTAEQTLPAETSEMHLQTPSYTSPPEVQEQKSTTKVEKIEEEKRKEKEMLEDESQQFHVTAKTTEESCLQKEEPTDLETAKENGSTADQTLLGEKSEEPLETPSSPLPSKEQEQRTINTVENIEEEKPKEVKMVEDVSQEDLIAASTTEKIGFQRDTSKELEVVIQDETAPGQTVQAAKSGEQIQTPCFSLPSEEYKHGTITTVVMKDTEMLKDENSEDSSAIEKTEETCLQKEELRELEVVTHHEITPSSTLPGEKSEEPLQTPSAFPSEKNKYGTTAMVKEIEERIKEAEMVNKESSGDASAATITEPVCFPKEGSSKLKVPQSWVEINKYIQESAAEVHEEEGRILDGDSKVEARANEKDMNCAASPSESEGITEQARQIDKTSNIEVEPSEEKPLEFETQIQSHEILTKLEDIEIKEKHHVAAVTDLRAKENQCETTVEATRNEVSSEEIMEKKAETSLPISLGEETAKEPHQEDELKAEEYPREKINEISNTTTNGIQNEEKLSAEKEEIGSSNKIEEQTLPEDTDVGDADQVLTKNEALIKEGFPDEDKDKDVKDAEKRMDLEDQKVETNFGNCTKKETTTGEEESGVQNSQKEGTNAFVEASEIIQGVQRLDITIPVTSDKQIPREADQIESTEIVASTGNEYAPPQVQPEITIETFQKAEREDLESENVKVVHSKVKEAELEGEKTTEESTSIDSAKASLSDLLQRSRKETSQVAKHETEEREPTASKEGTQNEEAETKEAKTDEEEEGDEHKKTDSGSDAPVMVEASRDIDIKVAHKKSHNILSGVGSKVKHSISKVKKAIIGKSSQPKPVSQK